MRGHCMRAERERAYMEGRNKKRFRVHASGSYPGGFYTTAIERPASCGRRDVQEVWPTPPEHRMCSPLPADAKKGRGVDICSGVNPPLLALQGPGGAPTADIVLVMPSTGADDAVQPLSYFQVFVVPFLCTASAPLVRGLTRRGTSEPPPSASEHPSWSPLRRNVCPCSSSAPPPPAGGGPVLVPMRSMLTKSEPAGTWQKHGSRGLTRRGSSAVVA